MQLIPLTFMQFFLMLALACSAIAQEPQPGEHPYLWRIPGAVDSWAYGTIHLSDPRVTTFHPDVEAAIEGADVVYTEIAMDARTMAKVMRGMRFQDDTTLNTLLPEQLRQRLNAELRRINPMLSIDAFNDMKVWVVTSIMVPLRDQLAHPGQPSVDQRIWNRGRSEGKDARALETAAEQLAVFDGLSNDEQIKMLEQTLDQLGEMREQGVDPLEDLIALYLSGRDDSFIKYFLEWSDPNDELTHQFMDAILNKRNVLMAQRMATFLREEPERSHFFAIGAAHFANNEEGLPALLEQHGFQLERLHAPQGDHQAP